MLHIGGNISDVSSKQVSVYLNYCSDRTEQKVGWLSRCECQLIAHPQNKKTLGAGQEVLQDVGKWCKKARIKGRFDVIGRPYLWEGNVNYFRICCINNEESLWDFKNVNTLILSNWSKITELVSGRSGI